MKKLVFVRDQARASIQINMRLNKNEFIEFNKSNQGTAISFPQIIGARHLSNELHELHELHGGVLLSTEKIIFSRRPRWVR
jgi:hypothetical protein